MFDIRMIAWIYEVPTAITMSLGDAYLLYITNVD